MLHVDMIGLESNYDFLRVYDTDQSSATPIAELTGTTQSSSFADAGHRLIRSDSGMMILKFTSDGSQSGLGVTARYYVDHASQSPRTNPYVVPGTVATRSPFGAACIGIVSYSMAAGIIDDGSGSAFYRPFTSCRWRIEPVNPRAGGRLRNYSLAEPSPRLKPEPWAWAWGRRLSLFLWRLRRLRLLSAESKWSKLSGGGQAGSC